jgi:ribosome-binding factor A
MTFDKRRRDILRAHCVEFGDDDGVNPRDDFPGYGSGCRGEGRKSQQLCRQIAETLDLVLSGDCRDETLQNLHVVSVEPAPNTSRLLVTLVADLPEAEVDRQAILDRLNRQAGRLRCEVAASIHRRRAPALAFNVIARPQAQDGGKGHC